MDCIIISEDIERDIIKFQKKGYYTMNKIKEILPPSQNRWRYGMREGQTFSTLTRFVENACNIYISK
jgi:hypothetical protein